MTIDITAVTKLRHSDLWDAAKKLGGQAALARYLGVGPADLGNWVSLKRVPAWERWDPEKRRDIEDKLFKVTGKTLDELFPAALRAATQFLKAPKSFEARQTFEADALLTYATNVRERLALPPPATSAGNSEVREDISAAIATLPPTLRTVIKLHFGLDGRAPMTLEEIGKMLKVTQEAVRQMELRGLRKLQNVTQLALHAVDYDNE